MMRSNSLENDMILAMGDGHRESGRPRTRWVDGIGHDTGWLHYKN